MANFEQLGREIDRELERLRQYLEKEVGPASRAKAAKALRKASERLAAAASRLEARAARLRK